MVDAVAQVEKGNHSYEEAEEKDSRQGLRSIAVGPLDHPIHLY